MKCLEQLLGSNEASINVSWQQPKQRSCHRTAGPGTLPPIWVSDPLSQATGVESQTFQKPSSPKKFYFLVPFTSTETWALILQMSIGQLWLIKIVAFPSSAEGRLRVLTCDLQLWSLTGSGLSPGTSVWPGMGNSLYYLPFLISKMGVIVWILPWHRLKCSHVILTTTALM